MKLRSSWLAVVAALGAAGCGDGAGAGGTTQTVTLGAGVDLSAVSSQANPAPQSLEVFFRYTGSTVASGGTLTQNHISLTTHEFSQAAAIYGTPTTYADRGSVWVDNFRALASYTPASEGSQSGSLRSATTVVIAGDSQHVDFTMRNASATYNTGDLIRLNMAGGGNPLNRTFATSYTVAELTGAVIKVAGAAMASSQYAIVANGSGKADLVFTVGNAPAAGAEITADITTP